MDHDRLGAVFRVWTPIAIVGGVVLTFTGSPTLTAIGVVVLILGLMSLLPVLRFTWLRGSKQ
jgi:hypothetical protein